MINLTIVWQPCPLHVLETEEQSGDKTCKIMQYWELDTWHPTSGQTSLSAKNAGSEGETGQPLRTPPAQIISISELSNLLEGQEG